MANGCLSFLKWSHVVITALAAILCIALVVIVSLGIGIDSKSYEYTTQTRLTVQVLAGVGIVCTLLGLLATCKLHFWLFLVYYLYVLFNGGFAIWVYLNDRSLLPYPITAWILVVLAAIFGEMLRRYKNHRAQQAGDELDQNQNPVREKLIIKYTGPKHDVPMKYIDDD